MTGSAAVLSSLSAGSARSSSIDASVKSAVTGSVVVVLVCLLLQPQANRIAAADKKAKTLFILFFTLSFVFVRYASSSAGSETSV
jgi:hypothetical protein